MAGGAQPNSGGDGNGVNRDVGENSGATASGVAAAATVTADAVAGAIDASNRLVLVTGASGFIGIHVTRALLNAGYRVRGTVRSTANVARCRPVLDCHPKAASHCELVEADLTLDAGWDEAVRGVGGVIHVASPFPNHVPKDAHRSLVQPAVDGTLRVLRAACAAGVQRVVLTSSIAAIHGHLETSPAHGNGDVVADDETCWTDLESPTLGPYERSKTLAEAAAWEFVRRLGGRVPDGLPAKAGAAALAAASVDATPPPSRVVGDTSRQTIELVAILPALVIGPIAGTDYGTSVQAIKKLIDGSTPLVPAVTFAFCDVRDVAVAHVRALSAPHAAGERVCVVSDTLWMQDAARVLAKEFSAMGYRVPLRRAPNFALWFASWFDPVVAMLLPRLDKVFRYSNVKLRRLLDIQPRSTELALVDTAYALIEAGLVRKTRAYRPKNVEL